LNQQERDGQDALTSDTTATIRTPARKPEWLKVRWTKSRASELVHRVIRFHGLHSVCEEALCPNQSECWGRGTATFLILGEVCTRNCGFCAVTTGIPACPEVEEPARVARASAALALRHLVITSVTRDDLADGGASLFADCVRQVRVSLPECTVELLVPDFQGNWQALAVVMDSRPEILGHNLETVPRLYPEVRPQADFKRSLELFRRAKAGRPDGLTKSGIMVGLGETWDELLETMQRLRTVDCDILTVGQYLSPTRRHLPVVRYYPPEEFVALRKAGYQAGFRWVEAGPLVRSSYHAEDQTQLLRHV
jgi:lipoic acid synthetase